MNDVERVRARLQKPAQLLKGIPGLAEMFERCFLNTLETTMTTLADGSTFLLTGDIPALWLRDSTEQMLPYLRFCREEPSLAALAEGLIAFQARCVRDDPYANAFNRESNGMHGYDDLPPALPCVWERKYEVDSLCHAVLLVKRYCEAMGNLNALNENVLQMFETVVSVFETEQRHEEQSPYTFQRFECPPTDTLAREGRGTPVGYTGMTWSGFRPSDDACQFGYLIPANLFAVKALNDISELSACAGSEELSLRAKELSEQIAQGIEAFGIVEHPRYGKMYAFEVDGLGNRLLMDDANLPGLLALPYLGICDLDDPIYQNTRAFVLSADNPFYYEGAFACGIGSPHTPPEHIWPISLCVRGMTANDNAEAARALKMLLRTHANTGFMHESFHKDDPASYTRSWFAWANAMFGELIYELYERGTLCEVVELAASMLAGGGAE